jgi:molecular chaperone HtpG
MKEEKFYEKVEGVCLFKTTDDKFKTLEELTSDDKKTIRYTTDPKAQAAYVEMSKNDGYEVIVMDHEIDNNFMSYMEMKKPDYKFKRVDSELSGNEADEETKNKLKDFFRSAVGNDKLIVFAQEMGKDNLPALIREAEHNRRMKEMRAQYERMMSMNNMSAEELADMFPETEELVVNTDSPLITKLEALESMGTKKEEADRLAQHIYDQAKLAHGSLDSAGLERFLKYNTELLSKSADNL